GLQRAGVGLIADAGLPVYVGVDTQCFVEKGPASDARWSLQPFEFLQLQASSIESGRSTQGIESEGLAIDAQLHPVGDQRAQIYRKRQTEQHLLQPSGREGFGGFRTIIFRHDVEAIDTQLIEQQGAIEQAHWLPRNTQPFYRQ